MIRRSLLLLVFVAAQLHAEDPVQRFRNARWTETALPAPWRAAIAKAVVEPIAGKGALWNAGCVVDPNLPRRRFVVAGTAAGLGIVVYEHGGFVCRR